MAGSHQEFIMDLAIALLSSQSSRRLPHFLFFPGVKGSSSYDMTADITVALGQQSVVRMPVLAVQTLFILG